MPKQRQNLETELKITDAPQPLQQTAIHISSRRKLVLKLHLQHTYMVLFCEKCNTCIVRKIKASAIEQPFWRMTNWSKLNFLRSDRCYCCPRIEYGKCSFHLYTIYICTYNIDIMTSCLFYMISSPLLPIPCPTREHLCKRAKI